MWHKNHEFFLIVKLKKEKFFVVKKLDKKKLEEEKLKEITKETKFLFTNVVLPGASFSNRRHKSTNIIEIWFAMWVLLKLKI